MKKLTGLSVGLCVLFIGMGVMAAQESGPGTPPPKVLVIAREFLKPGKGGVMHQKTEAAFVQAMSAAKWPVHYFAAESLSGRSRALFFVGYPSFEAWEKDNEATDKNATLSAALDRASVADGELLTEFGSSTFVYRDDLSLRADSGHIATMRYFEISNFKVKPGHRHDWDELVKMYKEGFEKAVPDAHWAVFESMYGTDNGGVYLVFNPMKSLVEVDHSFGDSKKFAEAMGKEGMKKLSELTALCVESEQTNLFHFSPKMSYPMDEWIKADPFWKPKMATATKKVATAAPAAQ